MLPLTPNSSSDGNFSEIDVSDEEGGVHPPPPLTQWHMTENVVKSARNKREMEMVMSVMATALDLAKAACALDEQKEPPEKPYYPALHKVLPYYEKAIHAMDMALDMIPDKVIERTQLKRRRVSYQSRMEQLKLTCMKPDKGERRRKDNPHQSRVPFIEQPHLNSNYTLEAPPQSYHRRPYWIMRLIRQTIEEGGYVSHSLFVPKGVWTQVGVKLPGFTFRVQAMENLLCIIMDKIMVLPKPEDHQTRVHNLKNLREFREGAHKLQNGLSRSIPFIPDVDTKLYATTEPGSSKDINLSQQKGNLSKLNSLVKNLGRNVKNTASIAYERIGASVANTRILDDELIYYSQLVSEVCRLYQVFDEWLVLVEMEKNDLPSEEENLGKTELLVELVFVSEFMHTTTNELIVRDMETLLERYLKKMRKSYVRIYWDTEDA